MEIDMEQIVTALRPFFDHIGTQFDQINARFTQIDARFDRMDQRFDKMDQRFDAMDQRFDSLEHRIESRFDAVEKDLYTVKTVLTKVVVDVAALRGEMIQVKETLAQTATKKDVAEITARMDDFTGRSALRAETLLDHDKRLRTLEKRLSN
ncbi:MAG: hypothetical protein HY077_18910 [Elusimicrobia bacterium]|nr:hypothetical protein [Elusimicrobiota bacterium]